MKVLNESASGATTFNAEYRQACKTAVRIMSLVRWGKVKIEEETKDG